MTGNTKKPRKPGRKTTQMQAQTQPARPAKKPRAKAAKQAATAAPTPDFQDMVDNAVQGILVHENFKPLYVNPSFAKLFGFEQQRAVKAMPSLTPLFPPEVWPQIVARHSAKLRGESIAPTARFRALRKDGKEIWISITTRIINWHGKTAFQWNMFDITTQMAAEEAVQNSEQRLSAMLEILPVAMYIARKSDGRILFVNRKTCLLFQQSAGPLLRGNTTGFFANQEDAKNIANLLNTVPDIREIEVEMLNVQGRKFTAEMAAINMDYAGVAAVLVAINDISARKQLEQELFLQANTDALTAISNRRHFMDQAEQELRRARRFGRELSLMMLDLDHFKSINDKFGHAAGDQVLQSFVKISADSLRQSDIMGRLGGEEFAVLLPETTLDQAIYVAERLRESIAARPIATIKGAVPASVSIGITRLSDEDLTLDLMLSRADELLYKAKKNGRNRTEAG